jgi:hypothetical protein
MAKKAKKTVEESSNEPQTNPMPEQNQNPAPEQTSNPTPIEEELDEEEREFRALRRDLPGVKGSSAAGIVAIKVDKTPGKNEFFRTHPTFRPVMSIVDVEVGMEKQFFAVTADMVNALAGIGITVSDHTLYFTVTSRGHYRVVPVRISDDAESENEYNRTRELGLIDGIQGWVRLYTDRENKCYKVFPAPAGRYGEPQFPNLTEARIFKLAFRDKGRMVDSPEHALFKKWAARDSD